MATRNRTRTYDGYRCTRAGFRKAAGELYERMGAGGLLRVPHDGSPPTIHIREMKRFSWKDCRGFIRFPRNWESYPVEKAAFEEVASTGFIHKLTEHGEPPPEQRKRGEGWRNGWRDMNLDGQSADWWVCTQ